MKNRFGRKAAVKFLVAIAGVVLLLGLLGFSRLVSADKSVAVLLNKADNTFTYVVAYDFGKSEVASAQFDITLSDASKLKVVQIKYDSQISGSAMGTVNTLDHGRPKGKGILYQTGFYSLKNQYKGKLTLCTITFSYQGDAPQTVTLNDLMLVRMSHNNKIVSTKPHWSNIITVNRARTGTKGDTAHSAAR